MSTPLLTGEGIRLEPLKATHISALKTIGVEPTIWRYLPVHVASAQDMQIWAEHAIELNRTEAAQVWVICLADGTVVGSTRLQDVHSVHRTGEIGFTWLAEPYRAAGINPRVKLLQLRHAFGTLALRRVAFKTHHANAASQGALLKLGAKYEGTFRNHMIMPDGSCRHSLWYSIVADEWPTVECALLARLHGEPLLTVQGGSARDVQSEHG